jgi:hypothetical protein
MSLLQRCCCLSDDIVSMRMYCFWIDNLNCMKLRQKGDWQGLRVLRHPIISSTPVVSKIPSEDDPIGSKHVKGKTVIIKNISN